MTNAVLLTRLAGSDVIALDTVDASALSVNVSIGCYKIGSRLTRRQPRSRSMNPVLGTASTARSAGAVGCDCDSTNTSEQRSWKVALHQALQRLQAHRDDIFENYAGGMLYDLWQARNDYIALRNGWEAPERFWTRHARSSRSDIEFIHMTQDLLEAEYWLQASWTSCGFFFEDLDRIEPRNTNERSRCRKANTFLYQITK